MIQSFHPLVCSYPMQLALIGIFYTVAFECLANLLLVLPLQPLEFAVFAGQQLLMSTAGLFVHTLLILTYLK